MFLRNKFIGLSALAIGSVGIAMSAWGQQANPLLDTNKKAEAAPSFGVPKAASAATPNAGNNPLQGLPNFLNQEATPPANQTAPNLGATQTQETQNNSNLFGIPDAAKSTQSDEEIKQRLQSLFNSGKFDEVEKILLAAIAKDPRDPGPWGLLVSVYVQTNRTEKALEACNKWLELAPNDSGPWNALALIYRKQNKLDKAIEIYGKLIQARPNNDSEYLMRGITWFYKQEYDIARTDFEHAVANNTKPDSNPLPEFWRGLSYAKMNQTRKAISAFTNAIKIEPAYNPVRVNRALSYLYLGDYDLALQDFNEAIRMDPTDAELYYKRGVTYGLLGNQERAVASYNEALRLKPDFAEAKQNLSEVQQQSRTGDAMATSRR